MLKKARELWEMAQDTALVRFIAPHKDKLPTKVEWPAMKVNRECWAEAALYIQQITQVIIEILLLSLVKAYAICHYNHLV